MSSHLLHSRFESWQAGKNLEVLGRTFINSQFPLCLLTHRWTWGGLIIGPRGRTLINGGVY